MKDTKDLLAQAVVALEAERAASMQAVASLQAQLDAAKAEIADLTDQWHKVDKTGATDVTDTVQALLDKGLPVPAGKYLIDPVQGLKVRGAAKLDANAILLAKATDAPRYCIVDVAGSIEGGQIIGDRERHTYTAGSTHEWGYGLILRDGAKASNLRVSQCTGDGIGVVGDHVEIREVVSTQNRRQGMSVFTSAGLRVFDSEFSYTNGAPNGPCAGVDFEPDNGSVTDAKLTGCTFTHNRADVLAWLRSEVGGTLDVTLEDCTTDGTSANGVWAKDEAGRAGSVKVALRGNKLGKHSGAAVKVDAGSVVTVGGEQAAANTFNNGATLKQGIATKYDIQGSGQKVVGWNRWP